MPGEDTHALKAQLAAAYVEIGAVRDANAKMGQRMRDAEAERDRLETAARAYIEGHELALTRAETAESERDAARTDVKRLRGMLDECVRIIDKMASNGARGRTWEIAQEVLLKARAALVTGGDRG